MIKFTKMQGIGNDYIYINCFETEIKNPEELSIEMSKRHFSVGSDGLVLICPSTVADCKMRMFNADGSEGKMCGNAIRCVAKFVYDEKIVNKTEITVETLSGIKTLTLFLKDGKVDTVKVQMGKAEIIPERIPCLCEKSINFPFTVNGKEYFGNAVSMGNPHNVIFCDEIKSLDLEKIGPSFENHKLFPERVNTEFVKVISSTEIDMRVWERGSGETYACGTGACASVVACVLNGRCDYEKEVSVNLIGGQLKIKVEKDLNVTMTGKAKRVYDGVYYED